MEFLFSEFRLDLLRNDRLIPPRPSPDLGYRVVKSGGQIHLGQFMSTAIFLLSNQLHDGIDGDQGLELLCSLLDRDASLATTLLRNHVPSIRAAWESLFHFSMAKRRRNTFRVLADIGFYNNWIHPLLNSIRVGPFLRGAIEMDCSDIVIKIVAECCGSSGRRWWRYSGEGILAACKKGNVECARQLIQHCDVNSREANYRGAGFEKYPSMFQDLISKAESSNDEHALALELFLANGADVDQKTERWIITQRWRKLVGQTELFESTEPTILDEVFYLNRSLFDELRPYSRVPASRVTRTGLLVALEDGSQALRDYLLARQDVLWSFNWRDVQPFLELLLAEQFTMSKRVDMRVVLGLCEFGVDFTMPSVQGDIQDFWIKGEHCGPNTCFLFTEKRSREFSWHEAANGNDGIRLLNMLLAKGGVIGELVLEGWVAHYGTGELECLASHLTDFPTKAVRALARAARLNNFQAVEFLLRKGVDPNAFVNTFGSRCSVPAIATQAPFFWAASNSSDTGCSLEMIQYLVGHGTELVVTPEDSTPFAFLGYLLRQRHLSDFFAKIKYVFEKLMEDNVSPLIPSYLLEMCFTWHFGPAKGELREQKLKTFEYLFRQGAEVSPWSPLAALAYHDGPDVLVRDVLNSGSDLDAYWRMDERRQFTPLQAAAKRGNESLVRLLIQAGANVNSPPAWRLGLYSAARHL